MLALKLDDSTYASLCHSYYSSSTSARHFANVHLLLFANKDLTQCPLCVIVLEDKIHVRNHAEVVRGIKTGKDTQSSRTECFLVGEGLKWIIDIYALVRFTKSGITYKKHQRKD